MSEWSVAVTLTYADDPDLSHEIITPKHFQKYIRSLRRAGHKIRYIAVGEYGALKGRAHFHAILFGTGTPPDMPHKVNFHCPFWTDENDKPRGHVFADWSADERAVRYVCKYILKNEKGRYWLTMSKKPPLGAGFFEKKAAQVVELGALPSSFVYHPPGGSSSRSYLMNGATRRDFLLAVVDGWIKKRPLDRQRLGEWVLKSLEKWERAAAIKNSRLTPLAELMESLADDIERKAPKQRSVERMLLETDHDNMKLLDEIRKMGFE